MSFGAAHHVRVQQQERLDVARAARQIVQLLAVQAAADRLAVERDVVRLARHGNRLADAADFERDIDQGVAGRADEHAGPLDLLEAGRHDLDLVIARLEIGRLVSALIVGLDGTRHAGRFVGDEHRCALHGRALLIDHGAANRPEK